MKADNGGELRRLYLKNAILNYRYICYTIPPTYKSNNPASLSQNSVPFPITHHPPLTYHTHTHTHISFHSIYNHQIHIHQPPQQRPSKPTNHRRASSTRSGKPSRSRDSLPGARARRVWAGMSDELHRPATLSATGIWVQRAQS